MLDLTGLTHKEMNISEKVIDIIKGMEGIGGIPTDEEFMNELDSRLDHLRVKSNGVLGGVMLTNDSDKNEFIINKSDLPNIDKKALEIANGLIKEVQPLIDIIKKYEA